MKSITTVLAISKCFSAMEQNAKWDPEITEIFLNLCITQINLGKRQGRSFSKETWDNIVSTFQQRTGRQYDRKKLKNKFDALRGEMHAWLAIKEESGVSWDPNLGTVTAPKAWWKQAGKVGSIIIHSSYFTMMPSYSFLTQVKLVVATMSIHNFIRMNSESDGDFLGVDNGGMIATDDDAEVDMVSSDGAMASSDDMSELRDRITRSIRRDMQNSLN